MSSSAWALPAVVVEQAPVQWTRPCTRPAHTALTAVCGQVPVLFAVDNYQALHSPSTYGEKRTAHSRRRLDPGELRVASAMRVLDGPPPAWGADVAALTWSEGYHAERDSVSAAAQMLDSGV